MTPWKNLCDATPKWAVAFIAGTSGAMLALEGWGGLARIAVAHFFVTPFLIDIVENLRKRRRKV